MTLTSGRDNLALNVSALDMGSAEVTLQDGDGNSAVTTFEKISGFANSDKIVPAAINVEESSDVIIGPVTQFNGPVTIYQSAKNGDGSLTISNRNGKLTKSESTCSDTGHPCDKPANNKLVFLSKHLKYVILAAIGLIVLVITITVVFLTQKTSNVDGGNGATVKDSSIPTGSGNWITREVWGGRPILNNTVPLKHPTPLVIISHTASQFCSTFEICAESVREFQSLHVAEYGSPDVGYNFLVGGDGNIYIGRGWDIRNFHQDNNIGISFIGNFVFDNLTEDMINATKSILDWGVKHGKLDEDYTLVCHNQTYATQSPGKNVYKVVKNWQHFYPDKIYRK